ncbi:BMP family ABC transporter substrate-binding protein [Caldibacillus lycopersici]|uniref:BMP family ABC transporter substrate-binding protein n=1 Tax=Perspicuibacillus lycopersici TaxID=1325689 RepID=A0AAE3ITX0_9BACI|nr:BMP family ABC transporter substrate-binding protein [Perspicuibacillus lycopersici]MCU9612045.1 BMP family ABC transporter substrate-binding protein [Perspicuibacillus lycopersici]
MKKSILSILSLLLVLGFVLVGCGKKEDDKQGASNNEGANNDAISIAMVTDTGGVDDKSFNQLAWEGLKAYGEENGLEKGDGGYDYLQSNTDADYVPNLNSLVRRDFDLIVATGFMLAEPIAEIADQKKDAKFVIIDSEVQKDNVASVMFKEQEASFLAGVAAALQTKTKKLGFVGGMESDVIERFETGFRAGVASVDPSIEVMINYTGSFGSPELGKAAANQMYTAGADIIFHASGGTGNGVFTEAVERKTADPNADVWVIGVDSDQYHLGKVNDDTNITLTSALKRIDVAINDVIKLTKEGNFPGGNTTTLGLAEDGVGLAETGGNLTAETLATVNEWKEKIVNGDLTVPGTYEELKSFEEQ